MFMQTETNEDYEEQLEEQTVDNVERNAEANDEYYEDNSPAYQQKDDLYSLFWKVINMPDSSKVGYLDKQEIGMLNMTVRDCQNIALLCDSVGYTETAKWLRKRAQIILRTSSSKGGWLVNLFVTAKKFSSKEKRVGVPGEPTSPSEQPQKKGFWSRFKR